MTFIREPAISLSRPNAASSLRSADATSKITFAARPRPIMGAYALIPARFPLRCAHAAQESWICHCRYLYAGVGNWRQHRHFYHHQLCASESAALPFPAAADFAGCPNQGWTIALLQPEPI